MMQKKGTTLNLAGVFISAVRFVGLVSFTISFGKWLSKEKIIIELNRWGGDRQSNLCNLLCLRQLNGPYLE